MANAVTAAAAELAVLFPHLASALTRDNTIEGHRGVTPGSIVNADVLHAMIVLKREVPSACQRACVLISEPWKSRPLDRCLVVLPRLHGRMRDLGLADAQRQLELAASHWVRVTKLALGLRNPDIPVGAACPACDQGDLYAAGQEGFLRKRDGAYVVEWISGGRIYCSHCAAGWTPAEWPHLGRVLAEAVTC